VARAILDRNGLWKVRVEPVAGTLTDHYDPSRKAVRLSEGNFRGSSIAAVSVAAHECGHAIQDGTGYLPMKLRAGLLPIVNLGAQLWFPLFFAGIVMGGAGLGQLFMQLSVLAFAGVLAFHVVTLPVEFDASRRAYGLLTRYGLLSRHETGGHEAGPYGGGLHVRSGGAHLPADAAVPDPRQPRVALAGSSCTGRPANSDGQQEPGRDKAGAPYRQRLRLRREARPLPGVGNPRVRNPT